MIESIRRAARRGSAHAPGRRWRPVFGRFLAGFCFFLLAVALPAAARAQTPPPNQDALRVSVETDRLDYRVGEPVMVRIAGTNLTAAPLTLQFRSGCLANYGFDDDAYDWLAHVACTADMPVVTLAPGETRKFGGFAHLPGAYLLQPGPHELWGEVVGYGRARLQIQVSAGDPPPLALLPRVEPAVAGPNDPVYFGLTVTNVSDVPRSYGETDGCPVKLTIDGWWRPAVPCTEQAGTVTLGPGESREYGAAGGGPAWLTYSPTADRVLPPGRHTAELALPGVGSARIDFVIEGGGGAWPGAIAGFVSDLMGEAVPGAKVSVLTWPERPDSLPPGGGPGGGNGGGPGDPTPQPGARFYADAVTGADGRYTVIDVPPGRYMVWATGQDGGISYYDKAATPEQATPVVVADVTVEGIDIRLQPGPPPPPPLPGVIEGSVTNWIPPGSEQPTRPIAGAVIVALLGPAPFDTTIVPDDSTGVGADGRPGGGGGTPPGGPNEPPDWIGGQRFYATTDEFGHFKMNVPFGSYKLVAGEVTHRYQWWQDADGLAAATVLTVDTEHPAGAASFGLKPLPANAQGVVAGTVYGTPGADGRDASGDSAGGPPDPTGRVPLSEARVMALPLIDNPLLLVPVQMYSATTDAAGHFTLPVPASSPYLVQAAAEGYRPQFYDHAGDFWASSAVDLAPGATTTGIDFDLVREYYPPPPEGGVLGGRVTTPDLAHPGPDGQVGDLPVANALVRVRPATPGFAPMEFVTRTDARGWWFLSGVPMGAATPVGATYLVSAEAEGFLPTYHPSAYRTADATPVAPQSPYLDRLPEVDISLRRAPADGDEFVAARVRTVPPTGWGTPPPDDGRPGAPTRPLGADTPTAPPDSVGQPAPLPGAFVYLVGADPLTEDHVIAGGVSCDNGTLILTNLPAGSYKAYADRPGFGLHWFGGDSRASATVFQLGNGAPGVLLDFVLESTDGIGPPPGGGNGGGDGDAEGGAPMTNLRSAPNPSRPQTTIMYRLGSAASVSLRIFDVNGRLVRTLFEESAQDQGEQNVPWDGTGDDGAQVGAGMYFYQVQAGPKMATGKMVIVR